MAGLYGARLCRPDEIVATLRLARRVSKWTKLDDRKLLRYLIYLRLLANLAPTGSFSTSDCESIAVRFWPDVDLAGDPSEDAKNISGLWI